MMMNHQRQQRFEPYIRNKRDLKIPFQTCNYLNKQERDATFPLLKDINVAQWSTTEQAYAFIMRSNNDDDIHKSIKYGIWTSTRNNNDMLTKAFIAAQEAGLEVFLFFSVVRSGQFVGVARLTSRYKEDSFPFWWQSKKWKGHFNVQWLQVKDIVNKNFEHLNNVEHIQVTRSRDGAPIDWNPSGRQLMTIFEQATDQNTILNDFAELDMRELALRQHKQQYPGQ